MALVTVCVSDFCLWRSALSSTVYVSSFSSSKLWAFREFEDVLVSEILAPASSAHADMTDGVCDETAEMLPGSESPSSHMGASAVVGAGGGSGSIEVLLLRVCGFAGLRVCGGAVLPSSRVFLRSRFLVSAAIGRRLVGPRLVRVPFFSCFLPPRSPGLQFPSLNPRHFFFRLPTNLPLLCPSACQPPALVFPEQRAPAG